MTARRDDLPTVAERPRAAKRISEEIVVMVRQQITDGRLQAGDRLPSEREMSLQWAVSRMAVREGMRNLESLGMVTLRKGRAGGAFVSDGTAGLVTRSLRDMLDMGRASLAMLMESRLLIMPAVVQLACRNATAADLAALAGNVDATEELTRAGRFEARTLKAIEFNKLLAVATGNHVLSAIVEALSEVTRQFVVAAGPRPHDPMLPLRRELLAHLHARDSEAAAANMVTYLTGLKTHLLQAKRKAERRKAKPERAGGPRAAAGNLQDR